MAWGRGGDEFEQERSKEYALFNELKFMKKSCPGNHKDINKPVKIGEISQ